jgi:hypothetical protein
MRWLGLLFVATLFIGPASAEDTNIAWGDWHMSSVSDPVFAEETNYFVGTPDLRRQTVLALQCTHNIRQYFFAVLAETFRPLRAGAKSTLYFHVDGEQEAVLSGTSLGNGMTAVFDDEASFELMLKSMQGEKGEAAIISTTQGLLPLPWVFSLRGFHESLKALVQRCGFNLRTGEDKKHR